MSVEHAVEAWAGAMVLLSVVLTVFVHPAFMWFTVFVGFMLFQQSFTGLCPATWLFRKLGLKSEKDLALAGRRD